MCIELVRHDGETVRGSGCRIGNSKMATRPSHGSRFARCGLTNPQHSLERADYLTISILRVSVDSGVIN